MNENDIVRCGRCFNTLHDIIHLDRRLSSPRLLSLDLWRRSRSLSNDRSRSRSRDRLRTRCSRSLFFSRRLECVATGDGERPISNDVFALEIWLCVSLAARVPTHKYRMRTNQMEIWMEEKNIPSNTLGSWKIFGWRELRKTEYWNGEFNKWMVPEFALTRDKVESYAERKLKEE